MNEQQLFDSTPSNDAVKIHNADDDGGRNEEKLKMNERN